MVDLGKTYGKIPPTSLSSKKKRKHYSNISNEEGSSAFDNMLTAGFQENDLIRIDSVCLAVNLNDILSQGHIEPAVAGG